MYEYFLLLATGLFRGAGSRYSLVRESLAVLTER